ncbi:MAG: peroxide stress protein YaaA [Bacillota bacterium]
MKIIISPAKKMNVNTDLFETSTPIFISETEKIKKTLQSLDGVSLQKLWGCGDAIARTNIARLEGMDLHANLTPAILSYEGLQYKHMGASVLSDIQLEYIETHLRILSGFYGVLKPLDGVVPYRLEMQARLKIEKEKDVYAFWGDKLAREIESGKSETTIINLASKEYSKAVLPYFSKKAKVVTVTFCEDVKGKLAEKGTMCKMARGEMVSFMSENGVTSHEELKSFNRLGYEYSKENSTEENIVFIKK